MTKRSAQIAQRISEQQRWIAEHGGTLAGYVARYGSKDEPDHYGNGGEAIFNADIGALVKLENHARSHGHI